MPVFLLDFFLHPGSMRLEHQQKEISWISTPRRHTHRGRSATSTLIASPSTGSNALRWRACQSFKFRSFTAQKKVCALVGIDAKRKGKTYNARWQVSQVLWWKRHAYPRSGRRYEALLELVFDALATNRNFLRALRCTGNQRLTHKIGSDDPTRSILTEREFVAQLYRLRRALRRR